MSPWLATVQLETSGGRCDMADRWGGSWGTSWAQSWDRGAGAAVCILPADTWGKSWCDSWGLSWQFRAVAPTPGGEGGGRIVGGTFSRGRWRELRRKRWEELESAIKAEEAAREQERLQEAADVVARAIAAAEAEGESAQVNADLVRMTNALEAAISAKRTTHALKKADQAMRVARELIEMEDEDDIVMLLLS